jgi:competence protein ComEA
MAREDESWRDRLGSLGGRELAGLIAVGVLVTGAVVLWYVRSLPRPIQVQTADGTVAGAAGADPAGGEPSAPATPSAIVTPASAAPPASPTEILVHVAGLVRNPGVYRFTQGQRVVDAIEAAGGARPGADLTTLNLAAILSDGEQVIVGKAGGGPGPPSGTSDGGTSSGSGGGGEGGAGPVNVNSATLEELESLPGIGPALGQRIIDYREQHGPFHAVDDLLNVSGIGDKTLEDLRPLITV